MIYFVTYDLHQHGRDYPAIERLLRSAPNSCHPMGSVWFIETTATTEAWRDALRQAGDANDEHFVARMSAQNWASFNLNPEAAVWLKDPRRTW